MTRNVEFFFDLGSSASYLAFTQLPALCAQEGARLDWRPMLLGGVFQATGNHSPAIVPAKGLYMQRDFERFAARYGVPFARNPHFPINTLTLMRCTTAVQMDAPDRLPEWLARVYPAIWVEGRNLNDPAVAAEVVGCAGFDAQALLARAGASEVKERLKAVTQEAIERGVFGAPTLFVGGEMFWGQDRLDFVREALRFSPPTPSTTERKTT